jgi:hypothetical protein
VFADARESVVDDLLLTHVIETYWAANPNVEADIFRQRDGHDTPVSLGPQRTTAGSGAKNGAYRAVGCDKYCRILALKYASSLSNMGQNLAC